MVSDVMFKTGKTERETPQWLWEELDLEFDFDLDAAATPENAKISIYYTKEDSSLELPWYNAAQGIRTIWVNPPYGKEVKYWVEKAYTESQKGAVVVMLLPARTDTGWFHDYILGKAEIRYLRGRLIFEEDGEPIKCLNQKTGKMQVCGAPFPSIIVIFRPPYQRSIR